MQGNSLVGANTTPPNVTAKALLPNNMGMTSDVWEQAVRGTNRLQGDGPTPDKCDQSGTDAMTARDRDQVTPSQIKVRMFVLLACIAHAPLHINETFLLH